MTSLSTFRMRSLSILVTDTFRPVYLYLDIMISYSLSPFLLTLIQTAGARLKNFMSFCMLLTFVFFLTMFLFFQILAVPNTAKGLRTLYDHIEKHLAALEENIDQNIFISMITSKIPKEVLIQLELQKGARNKWTIRELRELFSNYVVARERAKQNHYTAKGETREDYYKSMVSSAEALIVGSQAVGGKVENSVSANCRFCNASHWSNECTK